MFNNIRNAWIAKCIFEDQPLFTPPPIRGYNLLASGAGLTAVHDLASIGGALSSQTVAGTISSMVGLDQPSAPLAISGGWGQQRCSAIVEVIVEHLDGRQSMYRFRCYTDRIDFSHNGIPAPDLMMFVNNVEEVRLQGLTGVGIMSSQQVYYDNSNTGGYGEVVYTLRPSDVLTNVSYVRGVTKDRKVSGDFEDNFHKSAVASISEVPASISMALSPAPTWLATILNSYINSEREQANGINAVTALQGAIITTTKTEYYDNPFVQMLSKSINSITTSLGWFMFRDLCFVDPGLATDEQRNVHVTNSYYSTETDTLTSLGIEASIAQTVATHVRSWMYDSSIGALNFTATNMTVSGKVDVTFNDKVAMLAAVNPVARDSLLNQFSNSIVLLLIPQLSQGGLIELSITVVASHSSSIVVMVTVGTSYPKRFSFPAFMDNTFSPILSRQSCEVVGSSAELILDAIGVGVARSYTPVPANLTWPANYGPQAYVPQHQTPGPAPIYQPPAQPIYQPTTPVAPLVKRNFNL